MFSKEQIKEIQQKLGLLGMKDTAFPIASILDGNETVTIVQDSANKKLPLSEFAFNLTKLNPNIFTKEDYKDSKEIFDIGYDYVFDATLDSYRIDIDKEKWDKTLDAINYPKLIVANLNGAITSLNATSLHKDRMVFNTNIFDGTSVLIVSLQYVRSGEEYFILFNSNVYKLQELLINGETIKTINGKSILGAGNLVIEGASSGTSGGMTTIDASDLDYNKVLEIGLDSCILVTYAGHSYYAYTRGDGTNRVAIYGINTQYVDFSSYSMNYLKAVYTKNSNYPEITVGTNTIGKEVYVVKYLDYNYYGELNNYDGIVAIQHNGKTYNCTVNNEDSKISLQGSYIEQQEKQALIHTIEIQYTPTEIIGPNTYISVISKEKNSDIYFVDPNVFSVDTEYVPLKKAIESSKAIYIKIDNTVLYPAVPKEVNDSNIILGSTVNTNTEEGLIIGEAEFRFYPNKAARTVYTMHTLKTSGNGTKFLADNGEYKEVALSTLASHTSNGLMSKEDKIKLDSYNPTLFTTRLTQTEYTALASSGALREDTIYYIIG